MTQRTIETPLVAATNLLEVLRDGAASELEGRWRLAFTALDDERPQAETAKAIEALDPGPTDEGHYGRTLANAFRDGATAVTAIRRGLLRTGLEGFELERHAAIVWEHCAQWSPTSWQKLGAATCEEWAETGDILDIDPAEVRRWWQAVRKAEKSQGGDSAPSKASTTGNSSQEEKPELIAAHATMTDLRDMAVEVMQNHPDWADVAKRPQLILDITTTLHDMMVDATTL